MEVQLVQITSTCVFRVALAAAVLAVFGFLGLRHASRVEEPAAGQSAAAGQPNAL